MACDDSPTPPPQTGDLEWIRRSVSRKVRSQQLLGSPKPASHRSNFFGPLLDNPFIEPADHLNFRFQPRNPPPPASERPPPQLYGNPPRPSFLPFRQPGYRGAPTLEYVQRFDDATMVNEFGSDGVRTPGRRDRITGMAEVGVGKSICGDQM